QVGVTWDARLRPRHLSLLMCVLWVSTGVELPKKRGDSLTYETAKDRRVIPIFQQSTCYKVTHILYFKYLTAVRVFRYSPTLSFWQTRVADQDDEGIYHCANTERIGLVILSNLSIFSLNSDSLVPVKTAQLGEPATLTCAIPKELSIRGVNWYKQSVGDTLKLIVTLVAPMQPYFELRNRISGSHIVI
uniref:Ig-like domain-containing protein n=1 Tax=Haplochromis burtoni TaxID=8153 RepID=A0A3Q2VW74_HAPBU